MASSIANGNFYLFESLPQINLENHLFRLQRKINAIAKKKIESIKDCKKEIHISFNGIAIINK